MALVNQLLSYLNELQDRGESHVFLDPEAREVLNQLQQRKGGRSATAAAVAKDESKDISSAASDLAQARRELDNGPPIQAAPAVEAPIPRVEVPQEIQLPPGDRREQLNALALTCKAWPPSGALRTLRKKMVFAGGNPEARVMIIGDAPAFQEERAKKPFVGPAGQKLEQILKAMGLGFDQVYLTNLVKFRPSLPKQTTNDRKPTQEEIEVFLPIIKKELELVKPELVVALGETVAKALLGDQAGDLAACRGTFHTWLDVPLRVTFHPSYLLHNDSALGEKRKLWEDMLAVMEQLKLPISDKQRGFFKQ